MINNNNTTNVYSTVSGDVIFTDSISPPELAGAAALSTACLACLASFLRLIHRRIEVRHPVYALLFQSVAVQTAAQAASFAVMTFSVWDKGATARWIKMNVIMSFQIRHFHEVTWACVSRLRYVFVVRSRGGEGPPVDMDSARRRNLALVWALYAGQTVMFHVLRYAVNLIMDTGWPVTRWLELTPFQRVVTVTPSNILTTLPDLYSIAVYFRIRRMSSPQQQQSSPEGRSKVEPYGGIYVGEEKGEGVKEASSERDEQERKELRCVLLALRTYSLTCLLDYLFFFQTILFPEIFGVLLFNMLTRQVFTYWIPMATVAVNFGPLRAVLGECFRDLIPSRRCLCCCFRPTITNQVEPEADAAKADAKVDPQRTKY